MEPFRTHSFVQIRQATEGVMKAVMDLSFETNILFGQNPVGSICNINASERVSFV
jgi:hypothetical protein